MSWTSDPELQQMFASELEERSARLIEGAKQMQTGGVSDELAGAMLREGHTIKGTGRVMGYEAVSRSGQMIEQLWRQIQHGDFTPFPELGEALEAIALALPAAVDADPKEGTPELVDAIGRLNLVMTDEAPVSSPAEREPGPPPASPPRVEEPIASPPPEPSGLDEPPPEPDLDAEVIPLHRGRDTSPSEDHTDLAAAPAFGGPNTEGIELGGLIGAVENWAAEETMAVNAGRLYRLINEIADIRNELEAMATSLDQGSGADAIGDVARSFAELQHDALALAAVPLSGMTASLPQLVRYLAKKLDKDVRFEVVGDDEIAVDRQVLETMSDPLRQLIVNAVRHGIEPASVRKKKSKTVTGSVSITLGVKNRRLEIVVSDDGAGIDWELVRTNAIQQGLYPPSMGVDVERLRKVLYTPGFTTVRESELGGEGQGLATVAEAVEALFGRMKLESTAGVGTTVTVSVPTSGALQRVLLVEEAGSTWGIPEAVVDEVMGGSEALIDWTAKPPTLQWQGRAMPVVPFGDLVGIPGEGDPNEVVLVSHRLGDAAFTSERVVGVREVAVKELGPLLAGPPLVSGAALLGGDDVVLVLDVGQLIERARGGAVVQGSGAKVLVVDDSVGARAIVSGSLASSGFTTSVASSVAEALEILRTEGADAVVVDFSMPQEDGIALVDEVRANYSNMPVVMLSGVATADDQDRAKKAGVDAFFEKADFREGALAETLRRMLDANGGAG